MSATGVTNLKIFSDFFQLSRDFLRFFQNLISYFASSTFFSSGAGVEGMRTAVPLVCGRVKANISLCGVGGLGGGGGLIIIWNSSQEILKDFQSFHCL